MPRLIVTFLLLLVTLLVTGQDKSFIWPEGVPKDLNLGMSLAEFKQKVNMRTMRLDATRDWRTVYFQPSENTSIKTLIYYMAQEVDTQPLYEVIITYTSPQLANKNARDNFGAPNHIGEDSNTPNEWRFEATDENVAKWAWVYKNQIVMVARIPGCEWDVDWDE